MSCGAYQCFTVSITKYHLYQCVFNVGLVKVNPAYIRQMIRYIYAYSSAILVIKSILFNREIFITYRWVNLFKFWHCVIMKFFFSIPLIWRFHSSFEIFDKTCLFYICDLIQTLSCHHLYLLYVMMQIMWQHFHDKAISKIVDFKLLYFDIFANVHVNKMLVCFEWCDICCCLLIRWGGAGCGRAAEGVVPHHLAGDL